MGTFIADWGLIIWAVVFAIGFLIICWESSVEHVVGAVFLLLVWPAIFSIAAIIAAGALCVLPFVGVFHLVQWIKKRGAV